MKEAGSKVRAARPLARFHSRWEARGDSGMTLVECVVAIVLLVIVLLPTTMFVIESERAASQDHLEAEATTLADQALNGLQAEAARGDLPAGFQSVAQNIDEVGARKTDYTISTTWTPIVQGTNKTICAAGAGVSVAEQIWLVTASVTWVGMDGAAPVTDTTEIAPGTDGGLQQSSGELAVTLDSGFGTAIFQGAAVTATLTGVWTGSPPAPAVPPGQLVSLSETSVNARNGKFDGCLVFENIDAATGWQYVLSFAGNGSVTQAQEYSDDNPNGAFTVNDIVLQVGVPQIMTVDINTGTQINLGFTQGPNGSCTLPGLLTAPPTASEIPVTVYNGGLTSYVNDDWVAYNATASTAATFTTVYLYPSYSSQTAIWAGDGINSEQALPCTANPASGVAQQVYLQLYDLNLAVTGPGTSGLLKATDLGPVGALLSLTTVVAGHSLTDLPLGEYELSDNNGPITSGGSTAEVWVTATGNCLATTGSAVPPSPCTSAVITGLVAP